MTLTELIGWAAASMTLLAFTARDVRLLRLASVGASLAFITYGAAATVWTVLALHCVLLPVNLLRCANCCATLAIQRSAAQLVAGR